MILGKDLALRGDDWGMIGRLLKHRFKETSHLCHGNGVMDGFGAHVNIRLRQNNTCWCVNSQKSTSKGWQLKHFLHIFFKELLF